MEFKLINPTSENGFIQAIDFNFDEIQTELDAKLENYRNLTYTEEKIKEAKDDRAGLNKFRSALDAKRIEIKKLCLKPYEAFEAKMNILTGLVDEPINTIDTQIKGFEQRQKDDKRKDIEEFYNVSIGELKNILPLEKIFNDKWLNATVKINTVFDEIIKLIGKVNGDLKVINELKLSPEFELQVKDVYLKTFDISVALQEKNRLEALQKQIKEVEETQAVKEPKEEPQPGPEQETIVSPLKIEEVAPILQEKIYYREFFVSGTESKLTALREFMNKNGIKYGGIKQCQSKIA